jgi:hypothetical protein
MKEEYKDLQQKKWSEAATLLANHDELSHFLAELIGNFSYRYLENETTPSPIIENNAPLSFIVHSLEADMKVALKTTSSVARDGIVDLIKKVGLKNNPKVQYTLALSAQVSGQNKIEIKITTAINWNYPNFEIIKNSIHQKSITKNYSDFIEMRNELARLIEDSCDIF